MGRVIEAEGNQRRSYARRIRMSLIIPGAEEETLNLSAIEKLRADLAEKEKAILGQSAVGRIRARRGHSHTPRVLTTLGQLRHKDDEIITLYEETRNGL